MTNDRPGRAEQRLAADGGIACFSSCLLLFSFNADRAPQLKAGVRCLVRFGGSMTKAKSHTLIITVVAALLFGCCQASLAQSRGATLPHSMKGYELYSWKSRGEWHFSLLIGTNRLKTFSEVSSRQPRARGVRALKRTLNQLVKGEELTWSAGLVPRTVLPPDGIVDEVKRYCQQRGIVFRVNRRGARPHRMRG